MQRRIINDIPFTRVRNVIGRGYTYYADGGPGGNVQAWNSGEIDQGTMDGLVAWDREPYKDSEPTPPAKNFNMKNMGWR